MSEYESVQRWHWRDSMRTVRFFAFDAKASFPLVLLLVHMRTWTAILAVSILLIFWLLERQGLTLPAALRSARVWLIGKRRPALAWYNRRKLLDTGSK